MTSVYDYVLFCAAAFGGGFTASVVIDSIKLQLTKGMADAFKDLLKVSGTVSGVEQGRDFACGVISNLIDAYEGSDPEATAEIDGMTCKCKDVIVAMKILRSEFSNLPVDAVVSAALTDENNEEK